MLKNSKTIILICSLTSIAITIVFYLLAFNNIFTVPMRWVSLIFLLLAEAIGTIKAIYIKKPIFKEANILTTVIHIISVLILSIIFVNLIPFHIKSYILLNALALCFLLIIDIIIIFFGEYTSKKDSELSESQATLDFCYTTAKEIETLYSNSPFYKELSEICEMIKYSDNSSLTNDELAIVNKLEELKTLLNENSGATEDKITEIKNLIKLRTVKMSSQKRGGY